MDEPQNVLLDTVIMGKHEAHAKTWKTSLNFKWAGFMFAYSARRKPTTYIWDGLIVGISQCILAGNINSHI